LQATRFRRDKKKKKKTTTKKKKKSRMSVDARVLFKQHTLTDNERMTKAALLKSLIDAANKCKSGCGVPGANAASIRVDRDEPQALASGTYEVEAKQSLVKNRGVAFLKRSQKLAPLYEFLRGRPDLLDGISGNGDQAIQVLGIVGVAVARLDPQALSDFLQADDEGDANTIDLLARGLCDLDESIGDAYGAAEIAGAIQRMFDSEHKLFAGVLMADSANTGRVSVVQVHSIFKQCVCCLWMGAAMVACDKAADVQFSYSEERAGADLRKQVLIGICKL
jgi:hypothetical protein